MFSLPSKIEFLHGDLLLQSRETISMYVHKSLRNIDVLRLIIVYVLLIG